MFLNSLKSQLFKPQLPATGLCLTRCGRRSHNQLLSVSHLPKPHNIPNLKSSFSANPIKITPQKSSTTTATCHSATKTPTASPVYVLVKEPKSCTVLYLSSSVASVASMVWTFREEFYKRKAKADEELEVYSRKMHQMEVEDLLSKFEQRAKEMQKTINELKDKILAVGEKKTP